MIQTIYDDHKGNYGYRRIHLELRNRGFVINHKKVQRLMKLMGLAARTRCKRKYSSYKGEIGKKADNLIQRQFEGAKPYEKCYTDVTEFALPNIREKLSSDNSHCLLTKHLHTKCTNSGSTLWTMMLFAS